MISVLLQPVSIGRRIVVIAPADIWLFELGELGVGEEPSALPRRVNRDGLAGVVAVLGRHVPALGELVHAARGLDRHVSHRGDFAEALVHGHDAAPLHRLERYPAERWHDVSVDDAARCAAALACSTICSSS